jgi:branched-chain amino acid transport system permease protein
MTSATILRKQGLGDLTNLAVLAGALIITAVVVTALTSDYSQRIVLLLALNAILVISLGLGNGFTGVFSLGHVGFIAVGAYVSGIVSLSPEQKTSLLPEMPHWLQITTMSFLPATLLAGVCAAGLAIVVGLPLMRLSGHFVSVATMGFLIIVNVVLLNASSLTRGARTFTGVPLDTNLAWTFGWLFVTLVVTGRIVHSGVGLLIKAGRDDAIAASGVGVSVMNSRLLAFTVGAFFAGAGGSLYAHYLGSFSPNSFFWPLTIKLIVMLVLGGMGSLSGAVLGVVIVTFLSEFLQVLEQGISLDFVHIPPLFGASQIALGVIFILVMIYRPNGLMAEREFSLRAFLSPKTTVHKGE